MLLSGIVMVALWRAFWRAVFWALYRLAQYVRVAKINVGNTIITKEGFTGTVPNRF